MQSASMNLWNPYEASNIISSIERVIEKVTMELRPSAPSRGESVSGSLMTPVLVVWRIPSLESTNVNLHSARAWSAASISR